MLNLIILIPLLSFLYHRQAREAEEMTEPTDEQRRTWRRFSEPPALSDGGVLSNPIDDLEAWCRENGMSYEDLRGQHYSDH